jgi:hypothetical protein
MPANISFVSARTLASAEATVESENVTFDRNASATVGMRLFKTGGLSGAGFFMAQKRFPATVSSDGQKAVQSGRARNMPLQLPWTPLRCAAGSNLPSMHPTGAVARPAASVLHFLWMQIYTGPGMKSMASGRFLLFSSDGCCRPHNI